jgi:transcription antitermination factor NusG
MQDCVHAPQWFALRTTSGKERGVLVLLQHKGYEGFLPVYRVRRKWSDRIKEVELPLFPGYLFCRFPVAKRLPVLITPGVQTIVGYGPAPTPVQDEEIEALQKTVSAGIPAAPYPYLAEGQRVEIREGSLAGIRGILLHYKNTWRIVLSVTLLHRSVAVEIDRALVKPAGPGPEVANGMNATVGMWTSAR